MNRPVDDSALLQQPIQTAAQGVASVVGYWQKSTSEVKNLLANECEIILECKFCRSFYRTIRDFLSHKRQYCRTLLVQPNLKASKSALEIVEQARAQMANDSMTKEGSSGSENLAKCLKKSKSKTAENTKSKSSAHYAFSLPASSERMDLMSMPRLSKPPSADESDNDEASMPQLTMEGKIPAGRVALVPERSLRSRRLNPLQKTNNEVKESTVTEDSVLSRLHKFVPTVVDAEALKCLHKGCKDKNPFASLYVLAYHATLKHNRRFASSNSIPCFLCGGHFQRYNSMVEHLKDKHEKYRKESSRIFQTEEKEIKRGKKTRSNKGSNSAHSRSLSPANNDLVASEDVSDGDDLEEAPKLEIMHSDYSLNTDGDNTEKDMETDSTIRSEKLAEDPNSAIHKVQFDFVKCKEEADANEEEEKEKEEDTPASFEEEIQWCVRSLISIVCGDAFEAPESDFEREKTANQTTGHAKVKEERTGFTKAKGTVLARNKTKEEFNDNSEEEKEGPDIGTKERKVRKRVNPVWLNAYRQKTNEERLKRQQEMSEIRNANAAIARAARKTTKKAPIIEDDSSKPVEKLKRGDLGRAKSSNTDWDASGDESEKRGSSRKGGSDDDENEDSAQSDEDQAETVHETSSRPSRKRRKPNWIDDNDYVTTEFRKKYSRRSGASDNGVNVNATSEYDQSDSANSYRRNIHEGSVAEVFQSSASSRVTNDELDLKRSDATHFTLKNNASEASSTKTLSKNQKGASPERLPESIVLPSSQYSTPAKNMEMSNESTHNKRKPSKELRLHYTPRARKLKFGDTQTETLRETSGASTSEVTASPNSRRKQNLSKLGEGDDVTIVSFPNGRPPPCPQDLSSIPVYLTEMQRELFFSFIRPVSSSTDGAHKCMQCGQIVANMMDGRRHAVGHLRIMRLRCALCDCGSFFCSDMRTHLQMRHCEMLHRAPKGYVLPGDATPCMTDAQADELTKLVDPMKPGRVMYTSGKIVSAASHKPYYPDAEIEERVLGSARPSVLSGNSQKSASPAPKTPDG